MVIADLDGVYDPAQYNDRLLLGLKGTMSEAELHILKQRMNQGRLNKARRGERIPSVPIGYVQRPSGESTVDPDCAAGLRSCMGVGPWTTVAMDLPPGCPSSADCAG